MPRWLSGDYRITLLPLAVGSFFAWASAPAPIAYFCAPLAFGTTAAVYGLLGIRYQGVRLFAGLLFALGLAALVATVVGLVLHSYGWGFLTFAAGVPVAGLTFWRVAGRRR